MVTVVNQLPIISHFLKSTRITARKSALIQIKLLPHLIPLFLKFQFQTPFFLIHCYPLHPAKMFFHRLFRLNSTLYITIIITTINVHVYPYMLNITKTKQNTKKNSKTTFFCSRLLFLFFLFPFISDLYENVTADLFEAFTSFTNTFFAQINSYHK